MGYPIGITKQELANLRRLLEKEGQEVICLDPLVHVRTLLVAREMLIEGKTVKATITRGYEPTSVSGSFLRFFDAEEFLKRRKRGPYAPRKRQGKRQGKRGDSTIDSLGTPK